MKLVEAHSIFESTGNYETLILKVANVKGMEYVLPLFPATVNMCETLGSSFQDHRPSCPAPSSLTQPPLTLAKSLIIMNKDPKGSCGEQIIATSLFCFDLA